ncbi:hypothetical protein A2851_02740 [Candidatus Kaiserbacteria bacterium RIFCSPHIGHO2_01_FULL_53_29]|uniref:Uncharacterized protein n=1 Tax=Candidatus Kaiserbacteria bacterium RIFCSPHIGHO2_01_FULL_53_29 TaxID=1798480 RepID=A0A1F6CVL4_9BACT|nr:MAG: hypothetical protein A2851_02740 [Candidatus Kaiserbacteria bacterium RIFCSPHIGHO2_01_FULL_53_29]
MRYGALLGWGIVIYAVMALAWSGFGIYGLAGTIASRVLELLVLIIVATIAGRSLRFHSWNDILPYSVSWAILIGLLDAVYNVPFGGWEIYADWNLWVGYTLVVLVPLLAPFTRVSVQTREG